MFSKKKKKKEYNQIIDVIEDMFDKYNISGIVYIPDDGTYALYTSENGKFKVLDQAEFELRVQQKISETIITERVNRRLRNNKTKSKKISYIG